MKVRVWQDGAVLKITSFAPGVDIPSSWDELVRRGEAKNPHVEMEHTLLPVRKDADGVPQRNQWKLSGNTVIVDPTIRNIHREIFDKQTSVDQVKAKGRSINAADLLEIGKLEIELKNLIAESKT